MEEMYLSRRHMSSWSGVRENRSTYSGSQIVQMHNERRAMVTIPVEALGQLLCRFVIFAPRHVLLKATVENELLLIEHHLVEQPEMDRFVFVASISLRTSI